MGGFRKMPKIGPIGPHRSALGLNCMYVKISPCINTVNAVGVYTVKLC